MLRSRDRFFGFRLDRFVLYLDLAYLIDQGMIALSCRCVRTYHMIGLICSEGYTIQSPTSYVGFIDFVPYTIMPCCYTIFAIPHIVDSYFFNHLLLYNLLRGHLFAVFYGIGPILCLVNAPLFRLFQRGQKNPSSRHMSFKRTEKCKKIFYA